MFISAKVWKNDPFFDWNNSDDEKNGPSLVWNKCIICRQCILKENTPKSFIVKQTETNSALKNIWDK